MTQRSKGKDLSTRYRNRNKKGRSKVCGVSPDVLSEILVRTETDRNFLTSADRIKRARSLEECTQA